MLTVAVSSAAAALFLKVLASIVLDKLAQSPGESPYGVWGAVGTAAGAESL